MTPFEINLADIAMELGADIVLRWNNASFHYTNKTLKGLLDQGVPTTIYALMIYTLANEKMTDQQIIDWFGKKEQLGTNPSIEFTAPDGGALSVESRENAPLLNRFLESMEELK